MKCDIDQLDKIMDKLEAAQEEKQKKASEAMMNLELNAAGGTRRRFSEMIGDLVGEPVTRSIARR